MNKILFLLITNLFWIPAYTQGHQEVIESIRERYYRVNSDTVSLIHLEIDDFAFYLDGERLVVIKWNMEEGGFEYYYDRHEGGYIPYFIYFEARKSSELPDLRAYYNKKGDVVRYMEGTGEKDTDPYRGRFSYLFLDAKNALHRFFNTFEHARYPDDSRVINIQQEVRILREERTTIDTLSSEYIPDEGHFAAEDLVYKNSEGQPTMRWSYQGGEHGSISTITFEKKGKILCKIHAKTTAVGWISDTYETITYYENSQPFRTDTYRSYGTDIHHKDDVFDLSYSTKYGTNQVVPIIRYYTRDE